MACLWWTGLELGLGSGLPPSLPAPPPILMSRKENLASTKHSPRARQCSRALHRVLRLILKAVLPSRYPITDREAEQQAHSHSGWQGQSASVPRPPGSPAGSASSQVPQALFFVRAPIYSDKPELPNLLGAVTSMVQCDGAQSPRALKK